MVINRGDIVLANLGEENGSIQGGVRPVIIVQNNDGNKFSTTTIVCPFTSERKTNIPTHLWVNKGVGGLLRNSTILCEQIFTINKNDIMRKLGTITENDILIGLEKCLRISLNL